MVIGIIYCMVFFLFKLLRIYENLADHPDLFVIKKKLNISFLMFHSRTLSARFAIPSDTGIET